MRKSVRQGRGRAVIQHLPHFYQSGDYDNLLHGFVEIFGLMLDAAEEDLLRVMRAHWSGTADNEGSQGFDSKQKGDLDKIFALFLENLGGTTQLRQINRRDGTEGDADDAAYRERIKGLIAVLLRGANTREGIRAVVGANLGIFGDAMNDPEIRQKIQVIEFLAGTGAADDDQFSNPLALPVFGAFEVNNSDNPVASALRLRLKVTDPSNFLANNSWSLTNIRIRDLRTNQPWASYNGFLAKGDQLDFMPDGRILLNTVTVQKSDRFAPLPEGQKIPYQIEADFAPANGDALQAGRFMPDQQSFERTPSYFERTVFYPTISFFEESHSLLLLQPATFQVRIHWDIGEYTKKFDKPDDNTRSLIRHIVDKVKAAGVYSEINYIKELSDVHDISEQLNWGITYQENQDNKEGDITIGDFKKLYGNGLPHEMDERFAVSGVFDYSYFESLNTFA